MTVRRFPRLAVALSAELELEGGIVAVTTAPTAIFGVTWAKSC